MTNECNKLPQSSDASPVLTAEQIAEQWLARNTVRALAAECERLKATVKSCTAAMGAAIDDAERAEAANAQMRAELDVVVSQLRHAYANVHGGRVSRRGQREFADGLLAPQIRRLERLQAALSAPADPAPETT